MPSEKSDYWEVLLSLSDLHQSPMACWKPVLVTSLWQNTHHCFQNIKFVPPSKLANTSRKWKWWKRNDFDSWIILNFVSLYNNATQKEYLIKRFQYIGIFYCFSNFGTILIILFFFRTDDCSRKSPKPHHIQPPNSTHIWTLIRRCA